MVKRAGRATVKMLAEVLAKTITGKETLSAVLQRLSESHKGDTIRMRAASRWRCWMALWTSRPRV